MRDAAHAGELQTFKARFFRALAHPDQIPATYREADAPLVTQVADYVAGMTDRYALAAHQRLIASP